MSANGSEVTAMDSSHLAELLSGDPIIVAVKDERGLRAALDSRAEVVFLLFGNILNLPELTERVRRAGKSAFVHLDLIDGLAGRDIAADFVARNTAAAGVISTKSPLVKRSRELGLIAIHRFFLLDSMALESLEKELSKDSADFIEILPGLMPKMIRLLSGITRKPIIASGLISDKEDVIAALNAGAIAVSTTSQDVWTM